MHFIKSFSTALVNALLLTSTLGQLTQVRHRFNNERDLSVRVIKPSKFMLQYCSKAVPKTGKRDAEENDAAERDLEVRDKPVGYEEDPMDEFLEQTTAGLGLYSRGFGTCPGFVVTGTPAPKTNELPNGGSTKFLFHMLMGGRKTFADFATAVKDSKMTNLRGTMFTVDTCKSNPENCQAGMKEEVAGSESSFHELEVEFEKLCGKGRIDRQYYPWSSTGEMAVSKANYVTCK
ncbi:hypothetical protein BGZ60DRAFT_555036 [Tricladium varicosporioides]|nr:hypothetical protein BGZ60DRAFT_555036 [Hymenoscyphus varicosporioides]